MVNILEGGSTYGLIKIKPPLSSLFINHSFKLKLQSVLGFIQDMIDNYYINTQFLILLY